MSEFRRRVLNANIAEPIYPIIGIWAIPPEASAQWVRLTGAVDNTTALTIAAQDRAYQYSKIYFSNNGGWHGTRVSGGGNTLIQPAGIAQGSGYNCNWMTWYVSDYDTTKEAALLEFFNLYCYHWDDVIPANTNLYVRANGFPGYLLTQTDVACPMRIDGVDYWGFFGYGDTNLFYNRPVIIANTSYGPIWQTYTYLNTDHTKAGFYRISKQYENFKVWTTSTELTYANNSTFFLVYARNLIPPSIMKYKANYTFWDVYPCDKTTGVIPDDPDWFGCEISRDPTAYTDGAIVTPTYNLDFYWKYVQR